MDAVGQIKGLLLATARGEPMKQVAQAEAVEGRGLKGCRHARRRAGNARQVLLLEEASLASLGLSLGALKENVLISGLKLEGLSPGQRLLLGEQVVVELSGPCEPCSQLDVLRPGLMAESWGRRGQLARVVAGGWLKQGDAVQLLEVDAKAPGPSRPHSPRGMKGQLNVTTPEEYLALLEEPRRSEVAALDRLVRKAAPTLEPFIHSGMLAYGPFHYRYASGREGDWFKVGIASNVQSISLYVCAADEQGYLAERYREELPKARIGKSCIRIKRLADLDPKVLTRLLKQAAKTGFGL